MLTTSARHAQTSGTRAYHETAQRCLHARRVDGRAGGLCCPKGPHSFYCPFSNPVHSLPLRCLLPQVCYAAERDESPFLPSFLSPSLLSPCFPPLLPPFFLPTKQLPRPFHLDLLYHSQGSHNSFEARSGLKTCFVLPRPLPPPNIGAVFPPAPAQGHCLVIPPSNSPIAWCAHERVLLLPPFFLLLLPPPPPPGHPGRFTISSPMPLREAVAWVPRSP